VQQIEFSLADGSALINRLRSLGPFRWIPQKLNYQIVLAVLIAWGPLLIFTALDGMALGKFSSMQDSWWLCRAPSRLALTSTRASEVS